MIVGKHSKYKIQMKKYQDKAIPLIFKQQNKGKPGNIQYQANPQALAFLKSIQGKISIISVAGMYRTGKSYLLNTIMLKQKGGFAVGPTTNPKTKGIWIWGKPLIYKNEKDEMINVVVMDSQGLGSTEEDINHDVRLFSLTLLLSSMFIYNTIGAIDEHAIDSLGVVLKLCDHLKSQNYNDFPDFYWVLRDFSLALVGRDNKPLTPNKYLENSLSSQPGDSQTRNRIRQSIRSSFLSRNCYTFVRPLTNEQQLQKLDSLDIDQLRPQFTEQVLQFRKLINARIKTKKIKGKEINSTLLVELIKVYLGEINNKKLPEIETGWKYVCMRQCQNVLEGIDRQAEEAVNRLFDNLPSTKKELIEKREAIQDQLQRLFHSKTLNNDQAESFKGQILSILNKKMERVQEEMKVKNSQETKFFIKKQFQNIERRLKNGQFKSMGQLVKEFEIFYEYYRKKCPFKDEIQTGLQFLMKKFSDCSLIMFKHFKSKKDQEILKIRQESDRITSEFATRDEKQKHERTAAADKAAILQSRIEELLKQNRELSDLLARVQAQMQRVKNECEQRTNSAGDEAEYELLSIRKRLMEAQQQLQQMDCKRILQVNNIKNALALKENELAHYHEAAASQTTKTNSTLKELTAEREEKDKKIEELNSISDRLQAQIQRLKRSHESKLKEKEGEVQKLEQTLQARSSEIIRALQKKDNEIRTLRETFENEKLILSQNYKQQIKSIKETQKSELEERSLKIRKSQSDIAQRELQLKMYRLQLQKDAALLNQKLQFLRQECSDKEQRINKLQQENSFYMNAFDQKDTEISTLTNYLEDLRASHETNNQEQNSKINQLSQMLNEKSKEILRLEESQQNLKSQIRQKDQQIKHLSQRLKSSAKTYEEKMKEINERLQFEVQSAQNTRQTLQAQIDLLRTENSKSTEQQKRNIELSLVQLKNYYEMERQRMQKKFLQSRKKHEQSETNAITELENKHRKIQRGLQDEIQQLRTAKQSLEQQITRLENDFQIKIMAAQEERENEKRMIINRYELVEKKYGDLQQQYEAYEKNSEEERIVFVKKIEGLNFELSRKEKELLQLNSKKESLQTSLKKKEVQIESVKRMMNQEVEGSLKKVSDIQAKYQRINQEYMQYKIESDKEIALCKQRNEFLNAKLQDITRQKESTSSKNIEKLDKQKITDLKDQYEKAKAQIISLETRLESQRRSIKEQENMSLKKIANLEKQKQFLQQKQTINLAKISDLQAKIQIKNELFMKDLQEIRAKNTSEKQMLQKQFQEFRQQISTLEDEKNALNWKMEKDIALLNERIKYAEYQKDQIQREKEEIQKRFQNALEQIKKSSEKISEESEAKRNYSDKKYVGQIQVLRENMRTKQLQYQQSLRRLREENKAHKQKNQEYSDRLQALEKQKSGQKTLLEQIDVLKREKENLMMNYRNQRGRQNEEWKRKNNELDKKCKQLQKKNLDSIFTYEKESSKWNMERDALQQKIKQLSDSLEWQLNRNQLNKSKHELKKADSSNIFSTGSEYRSFGSGNWK